MPVDLLTQGINPSHTLKATRQWVAFFVLNHECLNPLSSPMSLHLAIPAAWLTASWRYWMPSRKSLSKRHIDSLTISLRSTFSYCLTNTFRALLISSSTVLGESTEYPHHLWLSCKISARLNHSVTHSITCTICRCFCSLVALSLATWITRSIQSSLNGYSRSSPAKVWI